jgi:short-subunit dehydrogenase
VDLLVHAAGVNHPGPLAVQPEHQWREQLEVNAYGALRVARAVAGSMCRRRTGCIINISSTNGYLAAPFLGAYSASKFALEALADAMRMELSPFGVRVITVRPGLMRTEFVQRAKQSLAAQMEQAPSEWRAPMQKFFHSTVWGDTNGGTDAERVARKVCDLALSTSPRSVVHVTWDAWAVRAFSLLPRAISDVVLAHLAGISPGEDRVRKIRTPA